MDDTTLRIMKLGAKGYSCAQILILMALEDRGRENPDLVRAMDGLAYGCGGGSGSCGALTGGCCLLALCTGKGTDAENGAEQLPLMLQAFTDAFIEKAGADAADLTCDAVAGPAGPAASHQKCGMLVADAYALATSILSQYGFDPFGG